MTTTRKRAISLLMTLALCLGLLPAPALAETGYPEVTVTGGGLTLYEDASADFSWRYTSLLPDCTDETVSSAYMPEVYAWAGSDTTMPSNIWIMTPSDVRRDGGSYRGGLYWTGGPGTEPALTAGDTCMVQIDVMKMSGDEGTVMTTGPIPVTVAEGSVLPTITQAAYDPVSTTLTVTFHTFDLDAGYFESYLLSKSHATASQMYVDGAYYYQWGAMSFDAGDAKHVTIDRDAGLVTLSQPLSFTGEEDNYYQYPQPDDDVFVVVETENDGMSGLLPLTVPEAGPNGKVTATMTSLEEGSMTTEFGDTLTGRIATLSVTMERQEGVNGFFIAPCHSDGSKVETGNMPFLRTEMKYNEETHTFDLAGYWEGTTAEAPKVYQGPNGETVTVTDTALTAEIKVCQYDSAPEYPHLGFADGENIVIYAQKGTQNLNAATKAITLEVPCAASSVGKTFVANDSPSPTITTDALPTATIGQPYSFALAGEPLKGGALSWSVTEGSALPQGLTRSSAGVLSGTPSALGTFSFGLTLTEAGVALPGTRTLSLKVKEEGPEITVTALPAANAGKPYTVKLTGTAAKGGALSWGLESGSSLPEGFTLTTDGVLSGTPVTAGSFPFTVCLTEAGFGTPATQKLTLKVSQAVKPTVTTTSLGKGSVGMAYSAFLEGTASNGGALSWSLTSGALPAGLTMTDGRISGTPTAAGTSSFTVTLTESWGNGFTASTEKTLSLAVLAAKNPVISTPSVLPSAKVDKPYSVALTGEGTIGGALSWSLSNGTLPNGLSLDSGSGVISGTPLAGLSLQAASYHDPGYGGDTDYYFTVRLTETKGEIVLYGEKDFTLTVNVPAACTVRFSLNGGSPAAGNEGLYQNRTVQEDETVTLPAAPERRGYEFTAWRSGVRDYQPGDAVTVNGSMTFTAQWQEKPAVTLTYDGQVTDTVALRGYYGDSYATIWSAFYREPATPEISVTSYYTSRYTFDSVSLWGYVDGNFTELAHRDGDLEDLAGGAVALTPTGSFSMVTAVSVKGLAEGTDFTVSSIRRVNEEGSWYNYYSYRNLPFLSRAGQTYEVTLNGVSDSETYEKYHWTTCSAAVSAGGVLEVTPTAVAPDLTVTGRVYYGSGTDTPIPYAQVQVTQWAYDMDRTMTVETDEQGAYSIPCFSGKSAAWRVTLGGSQVAYDYDTPDGSAKDFHVEYYPVLVTATLDTGDLSPDTAKKVRDRIGGARVELLRSSDQKYLDSGYIYPGSSDNLYIRDLDSRRIDVDWKVDGNTYIAASSGKAVVDFTSWESVVIDTAVKPNAGVLADLSAGFSSHYALVWFDAGGTYVGSTWSGYLSSERRTILSPCPAETKSGTFTVAVMNNLNAYSLSTLSAIPEDWILKQWTVTLAENEIKELEAFRVEDPAGENAMYVTKPGSTMTADRESFSGTDDLVRFTGTIALDAGLTNGKLIHLEISPRNNADNISYSNSAPMQNLVIGGKVLQASDFTMASSGYYYIDFPQPIELPCEYTLYCKPGAPDWDMQVKMTGSVSYDGGSAFNSPIGEAVVKKPGASLSTLSSCVCGDEVALKGVARPDEEISIFDNSLLIGSATADSRGAWSAKVPLKFTDPKYATTHILSAETASGVTSENLYVFHDAAGPELTRFRMAWNGREIDVGDAYTYAGGMRELTFKATFLHPDKLRTMTAWDSGKEALVNAKVVFKYYLTNGEIGWLTADTCGENGVFVSTTLPRTLYSSVARVEPLYQPILNERLLDEEDGSVFAMTQTEQDSYLEYMDDEVDRLSDLLKDKTGADDFTVTFDENGKGSLTGADPTAEGEEDFLTQYQEIADEMAAEGGQLQSYRMSYNDRKSVLEWVHQAGADWVASKPLENHPDAFYGAAYTAYYAGKADFLTEMGLIAGAAQYHSGTVSDDGKVTMDQYFFTDADVSQTGEFIGGTFLLSVDGFADDDHGLWMANFDLSLTPYFESFGSLVPNTPVTLQGAGPQLMDGDSGKLKFNPQAQKVSIMLDILRTISDLSGDQSFYQGTANGLATILSSLKNTPGIKELMENLNALEGLKELGGTDMIVDSLGYGSAAYAIINQLISTYDAIFGQTEAQSMLLQMDAWMKSPCWQKIMQEYQKNLEDNMFTAPAELGQLMAMGVDPNQLSYYMNSMSQYTNVNTGEASPEVKDYQQRVQQIQDKFQESVIAGAGYELMYAAGFANNTVGNGAAVYGVLNAKTLLWLGTKALTAKAAVPLGVGVYLAGKYASNSMANQTERIAKLYNELGQMFVELLDAYSGRLNDEDCNEMEKLLTGQSPIPNKTVNDPSGVVFEAVIENPVPDADVTLYYAVDSGGRLVKEADKAIADHIVQADQVRDLVPGQATQTTDENGRYAWGVPEGLWYVTAEHAGYEAGNSNADAAANVSAAGHKLLPVLPVQLNVNIPLADRTAPYVTDTRFTDEGVYVTFSKYMDETTCLNAGSYAVRVNGADADISAVTAAEQGHVPDNLPDAGTTYTRTVLVKLTGLWSGDSIDLTVKGSVKSYAGTAMGEDASLSGSAAAREQLPVPTATVNGKDAPVFVRRGDGVELSIPGPDNAKIFYRLNGGEAKEYTEPVVVSGNLTLEVWAAAPGYADSDHVTGVFLCGSTEHTLAGIVETSDGGSADGMTVTLRSEEGGLKSTTVTGSGFTFGIVREGSYTLTCSGSDVYRDKTQDVTVSGGSAVEVLSLEARTVTPSVEITAVSGSTFYYTVSNAPEDASLIAARYDNGQMTAIQMIAAPEASGTLTMKGTGAAFKLFLVNTQTSQPLCEAWGWSK